MKIGELQFGFVPGKGTRDAIYSFVYCICIQEVQREERETDSSFVDLEKAFDSLTRKVIRWVLKN